MSKQFQNIGIVGAGKIAEEHLKVLEINKFFVLNGIYSRTKKKCIMLAKSYKIKKIHNSLESIINDKDIDAFIVLVSTSEILKVLKKIIPSGKPFFVEKPAGMNLDQNKIILKLVTKHKNLNMVGYNRRFYSIFEKGMKIINNHGKLLGITIEGHERFWKIKNIIDKQHINDWFYSSSHTIDLIRYFIGEIKNMNFFKTKLKEKNFDQFVLSFKSNNNIIGTYTSHWYSPGGWSIKLYGEKVSVIFDPLEKGYWIDKNFKKYQINPNKVDKLFKPGFYKQMKYFEKLLITNRNIWPSQNIMDSNQTMKLINNIIKN